jgi:polyhydroxybutyrate depolymerase
VRRVTLCALATVVCVFGSASSAGFAAASGKPARQRACVITAGVRTETLDFEGSPRTFRVVGPARLAKGRLPLILNFHGLGSSADRQAVYSQLEAKGPERGYVVVTPQGTGSRAFWNILPNLPKPDDLAFTSALIEAVNERVCPIDPKRVYATGISNGAGMSALLGCERAKQFAAIAPVAGVNLVQPCPRGAPVSVIAFHGRADAVVKYDGGPPAVGATNLDLVPVEEAVRAFAERDDCRTHPAKTAIGSEVERSNYPGCRAGTAVVLYSVSDGGHTWPGSIDVPRLGHVTQDINAADLILDFFDEHARPTTSSKS